MDQHTTTDANENDSNRRVTLSTAAALGQRLVNHRTNIDTAGADSNQRVTRPRTAKYSYRRTHKYVCIYNAALIREAHVPDQRNIPTAEYIYIYIYIYIYTSDSNKNICFLEKYISIHAHLCTYATLSI